MSTEARKTLVECLRGGDAEAILWLFLAALLSPMVCQGRGSLACEDAMKGEKLSEIEVVVVTPNLQRKILSSMGHVRTP